MLHRENKIRLNLGTDCRDREKCV